MVFLAFSISGNPISRVEYKEELKKAELKKAELEIKNGNVISHEDLERESENW